ncbi:hypothetical protein G647_08936 [Cladophialophora carrionii CBS 160.54]|uniref:NAD-dependent epimerase/dehydratase domain-containing protein n=1 Tax=Cladophialophora carrionii CBS 160.54 TaxID=1279043 RepID=V9CZW0_9EURO|nr:uncharacterized protein G647_08936 [Cladophialophora carrionii CBS 160.54]ETI19921.1 hypothetical protein G647_08936 [Cladophialophora carrionii CBS 160.54]
MPTTLVTGSTGFVGASVVDELLRQSHSLILAVRSPSSAKALIENNPSWPASALTVFAVPDFTDPGAFDSVFQKHPEIEYIVHVAAPMLDNPAHTDFVEHFEKPSVLGNLELLKSAKEYGKNVKAISVTGSLNAITTGSQEDVKSRVFGNKEWLPLGREDAIQANHNYAKAIWRFVKEERPSFTVTNFMPPLIWGPMLQPVKDIGRINFSNSLIKAIMDSKSSETGKVPNSAFPAWIDVRDLAKLQILALTTPGAADKRFLVGRTMIFNHVADVLRNDAQLGLADRVGEDNDEASTLTLPRLDISEVEEVFKYKWTPLSETAQDAAASLLEIEERP